MASGARPYTFTSKARPGTVRAMAESVGISEAAMWWRRKNWPEDKWMSPARPYGDWRKGKSN